MTSSLPHYMMATAASMAKQQPPVKKEKTEAGIPSYMRSTASSRAMDQTRPLKKEEKRLAPSV